MQAGVNLIAQGTTESTRIGRKCTIRSINWRFNLKQPTASGGAAGTDTVRVLLVLDKQCNGALPAVTDVLEADNFQSFNNLANKTRFRTLMDRTYELNGGISGDGTTLDTGEDMLNDSFFKRVNLPIEFDSTAGAITEIRSNNLVVLLAAKEGTVIFDSKIRLRFSDN